MVMPSNQDRMTMRMHQGQPQSPAVTSTAAGVLAAMAPPPWRIEIPAADGSMLLVLREENGRLVADYDPLKLDEAARLLLLEMLRMAGGAGIRWRDVARG